MANEEQKIGYQMAIQLALKEADVIWKVFQSMLAANSLLIVAVGAIIKMFPQYSFAKDLFAIMGILLCIAWILITVRSYEYHKYWIAWARHLENCLDPQVKIMRQGQLFSRGEQAHIIPDDEYNYKKMSGAGRLFRIEWLMHFIIIIFIFIYFMILLAKQTSQQSL
jgi:hypothetical protein